MPQTSNPSENEVLIDRRRKERRDSESSLETESPKTEFKQPRRRQERRRQIDPTTCERDYNSDEIVFMQALDAYKRSSGRMFPTCSEILEVIGELGYVKLSEEERLILKSIEEVEAELTESAPHTAEDELKLADDFEDIDESAFA